MPIGKNIGGTNGGEILYGTNLDDVIKGIGGDDRLEGGYGNDILQGGSGADVLNGGEGIDTADYTYSNGGVLVNLALGIGMGGEAQGDTLKSIENVTGSGYSDAIGGDWMNNILRGAGGDDIINGLDGNDMIDGGAGADAMMGGAGDDILSYTSATSGVIVGLLKGDQMGGAAAGDTLPNYDFENLIGSAYDDHLFGNAGSNYIHGGAGHDIIEGRGGHDRLYGNAGDDYINGGEGNDVLYGEAGLDTLSGGSGMDQFVWMTTNETGVTAATADRITDFNSAEFDRIAIVNIDANVYADGYQFFHFIGTAAFSGTPGELRYYHADGNTFIEMQTGTSVDVEGVIRLDGIHTVQASWFY